ncbi:MAG: hypothetical protein ABSA15_03015 [Thermoplasmata archaeon]|jgi:hypothetical protein
MRGEKDMAGKGMVEGLIVAMSDKHTQLDLRLKGLTLNLVGAPVKLELNGTVSVSVHMRDLTKEESAALAAEHIALTKT